MGRGESWGGSWEEEGVGKGGGSWEEERVGEGGGKGGGVSWEGRRRELGKEEEGIGKGGGSWEGKRRELERGGKGEEWGMFEVEGKMDKKKDENLKRWK